MFGGSVRTIKAKAEAVVVASTEIGLDVNADKTKYVVMSRDQNPRPCYRITTDNSFFERMEEFKYWGTTLTYQNSIQEEIKGRLESVKACYNSQHKRMFSNLLSNNLKI
jgi:hypothetical protein